MPSLGDEIKVRASKYADRRGLGVEQPLGFGKDGSVFQTSLSTAIKVFARNDIYTRELACYHRLTTYGVEETRGHVVPRLIWSDDELWVIEMEIVTPPYLLDFADAWLDVPPQFSDEVMEEWDAEKREQFGPRWEEVQLVVAELRGSYGIYLLDVNPGNITFESDIE